MAKRGAQSDLNHDNWNEEEESEEAGHFAQASSEELKKRVIKTARRRGTGTDSGAGGSSSVFGAFKGFSGVTSTPAVKPAGEGGASPFSFLSGIAKPTNGTAAATTSALGASIFASTDPSKKVFSGFGSPPKEAVKVDGEKASSSSEEEYAANVKALNVAVAAWISEKVKENPICKLSPIFKDYEKYLEDIEAKKNSSGKDTKESAPAKPAAASTGFTFGSVTPASATPAPAPTGAAKPFSFGFGSSTGTSSTPGTGFSFANVAKPAEDASKSDEKAAAADDDEDEPPKVEFTPVEEKDSIFSKRCKLFVKADGNYSDRGIGTLHIKKVDSKVQVLVRADTSLGQILLNIILNEAVPVQRMGKNNVMMVCVPTPESKPPPTSVLLRVKTGEEADELYETLMKHKPK